MLNAMSRAAKAWTALSIGGLAWGASVVASAPASITASEWLQAAGIVVGAIGVYLFPNTPPSPPDVLPLEATPRPAPIPTTSMSDVPTPPTS